MTIHVEKPKGLPQSVTTGPIQGSRKVYASLQGRPDIRVPLREIALSDPNEPAVRVYDPSGPYTETDSGIDLNKVLYDQEAIRKVNPQRGDMEHLNGIVHVAAERGEIIGFKDVREDEF